MKKVFLSLLFCLVVLTGTTNAQTDPFRGTSGYVFSTNYDWTIVRFGLNRFTDSFTNTEWLGSADGFYGGAAVANGVMYGTTVLQILYAFNLTDGSWTKTSTNKYWEDMAYDYTTGNMYCVIENGFGKLDLATGQSTLIQHYGNIYFWGIGCTHDGRLYAVGQDGLLYSIEKESGATTIIGNTGLASTYICCAAIDPNTDILYFEHCTDSFDRLYTIDLETAQATFVCDYDEISGLSFDYEYHSVNSLNVEKIEAEVYPNPVTTNVTIEAEGMNRVTITNSLGQVVFDVETSSNLINVDMTQYEAGMYIARIMTDNGMSTKKIFR